MCEPTTTTLMIASLAVAVASAGAGFAQQAMSASAQDKANEENFAIQMEQLKLQSEQIDEGAIDEKSARAREAKIEKARIRVVGGESGLSGNSLETNEEESDFNLGTDLASIESNRLADQKQLNSEGKSLRAGAKSRRNSIKRPSLVGTGLSIGGAIVDAGVTRAKLTAPRRGAIT